MNNNDSLVGIVIVNNMGADFDMEDINDGEESEYDFYSTFTALLVSLIQRFITNVSRDEAEKKAKELLDKLHKYNNSILGSDNRGVYY